MDGTHGRRIWSYRQKYRTIDGLRENTINAALRRMGYSTKEDITGHGFRATARTILDERLGFDRAAIEARRQSPRVHAPAVKAALAAISSELGQRHRPYAERAARQAGQTAPISTSGLSS